MAEPLRFYMDEHYPGPVTVFAPPRVPQIFRPHEPTVYRCGLLDKKTGVANPSDYSQGHS